VAMVRGSPEASQFKLGHYPHGRLGAQIATFFELAALRGEAPARRRPPSEHPHLERRAVHRSLVVGQLSPA
jgi:hypothetical protein